MTTGLLTHRSPGRSGLTLVETLLAIALLAAIASTCLGMISGLKRRVESLDGAGLPAGVARVVIDELVRSPDRFGLGSLYELTVRPTELTLDEQFLCLSDQAARHATPPRGRATPVARAWIVQSSNGDRGDGVERRSDRLRDAVPCWLLVQVDDDIAACCIMARSEDRP